MAGDNLMNIYAGCVYMNVSLNIPYPNKLSISIHTSRLLEVTIMVTKRPWTIYYYHDSIFSGDAQG